MHSQYFRGTGSSTTDKPLIIATAQEGIKRLYPNGFTCAVNQLQESGDCS